MATIGTVFAYQSVVNLLQRGYPHLRNIGFYFSQDFPAGFYGDNLILIGFPKTNRVTNDVFERLRPPVVFDGHQLVEQATGQRFTAKLAEGVRVVEDYGCFVRARNPYNPESVVLVLAGSQTYGMKAAADYLDSVCLSGGRLRGRLSMLILRRRPAGSASRTLESVHCQVVLKVHVERYFTSSPEVVAQFSL